MNERTKYVSQDMGHRLVTAILLNVGITIAEIVGGIISGSLALISDALHNFSDVVALGISGAALRIAQKPKTPRYTFGMKRAEILAAALNAVVLVVICLFIVEEAISRFRHPVLPSGTIMIIVGAVGLLANAGGTLLLHSFSHKSLNLRSAYLHLFGDTVSSFGVVIGGIAVQLWSIPWIDPIVSCMIAVYVLWESYKILKDTTNIMMMGAPITLSVNEIDAALRAIPGIENIHHVHLWQLSETDVHFEAHVSVNDMLVSQTETVIHTIESELRERFGIRHTTIQCECDRCGHQRLIA
jgi:cobalt-zinc-cadmium efflux system protein